MKRLLAALLLVAAPTLAQTPTPTATPSPTPTRTPTPTVTPTMTRTPTPVIPSRYSLAQQVRPGFGTFSTETTANKLGDTYYATDYQSFGKVAGNITTTRKWFRQTGTGAISAAPAWDTLVSGDIPNNAANTTGSAAKWTTARLLAGNSVDGSANAAFANAFIVKGTADSGLSGAQFLGALGTGILKNTTTTGTLSIAAGSDLPPLLSVKGDLLAYSSSQGVLGVGVNGLCLVTDSTATFGFKWDSCATGAGTVTSIATTAPITGGTITATGTIGISSFAATAPLPGAVPDATGAGAGAYLDKTGGWTVPSGTGATSPLTTKGDIWVYSTGDTRLGVGTDGKFLTADSTQATGLNWSTQGAPPSMVIRVDPNFTIPASYERLGGNVNNGGGGTIALLGVGNWPVTKANAISSVPEGWTWLNTTNLTSADENTTTANALRMTHNTSATDDFFTATYTAPRLFRSLQSGLATDVIARAKIGMTQTGAAAIMTLQNDCDTCVEWCGASWDTNGIGFSYRSNNGASHNYAGSEKTNGLWVLLRHFGSGCSMFYNTSTSTTPPLGGWAFLDQNTWNTTNIDTLGPRVNLGIKRFNTTPTSNVWVDWMYFEDDAASPSTMMLVNKLIGNTTSYAYGFNASAFDDSGPAVTLVASYDLGSGGTTVTDANVRSAVTQAQNQRFFDTGAWTYSAVRSASANPAASTYQASGSITVGGSGRYFALYAKCTSTGRVQPCSLNTDAISIPFTPASFGLGSLSGSGTAGRLAYWGGTNEVTSDSSAVWDSTNHRLGIGTSVPDSPATVHANAAAPLAPTAGTLLHLSQVDGTSSRASIDAFGAAPAIEFRRADTSLAAASAVQSGETIGNVGAKGYGATAFPAAVRAQQKYVADQTWTDSAQGTSVIWSTTANSTVTTQDNAKLDNAGNFYLSDGTTTLATAKVGGALFTQTADSSTTGNSLTTLFGTGVGSLTLPANLLIAGRTIRITMGGVVGTSDGGAGTKTLTLKLGGTTVATGATGATFSFTTGNDGWKAEATIVCRTTGSSGTVHGGGSLFGNTGASTDAQVWAVATATTTINTTTTLAVDLLYNNGNGTGSLKTTYATVEVVN